VSLTRTQWLEAVALFWDRPSPGAPDVVWIDVGDILAGLLDCVVEGLFEFGFQLMFQGFEWIWSTRTGKVLLILALAGACMWSLTVARSLADRERASRSPGQGDSGSTIRKAGAPKNWHALYYRPKQYLVEQT
jgi:hypothetical protein